VERVAVDDDRLAVPEQLEVASAFRCPPSTGTAGRSVIVPDFLGHARDRQPAEVGDAAADEFVRLFDAGARWRDNKATSEDINRRTVIAKRPGRSWFAVPAERHCEFAAARTPQDRRDTEEALALGDDRRVS